MQNRLMTLFVLENIILHLTSKTCSACGHIHAALMLADRVFHCPICGQTQDRDLNAAINLKQYGGLPRKSRLRTTRLCLVRQHLAPRLAETGS